MNDNSMEEQPEGRAVREQRVVFCSERRRSDEVFDQYSAVCRMHAW